jgi:hypothetical protein
MPQCWRYSSLAKLVLSMLQALGSIPNIKKEREREKKEKEKNLVA